MCIVRNNARILRPAIESGLYMTTFSFYSHIMHKCICGDHEKNVHCVFDGTLTDNTSCTCHVHVSSKYQRNAQLRRLFICLFFTPTCFRSLLLSAIGCSLTRWSQELPKHVCVSNMQIHAITSVFE